MGTNPRQEAICPHRFRGGLCQVPHQNAVVIGAWSFQHQPSEEGDDWGWKVLTTNGRGDLEHAL